MKKFTCEQKGNGELAIRSMSEKAQRAYNSFDAMSLKVYEYINDDNEKLYAYDGYYGYADGLTFEEMQETLEGWYDEPLDFEVYEDNGGGLYLYVLDADGKCIYAHSGYEYNYGQLSQDIDLLREGSNPIEDGWDNNEKEESLVKNYPQFVKDFEQTIGIELIADQKHIYPRDMGHNGFEEFEFNDDESTKPCMSWEEYDEYWKKMHYNF